MKIRTALVLILASLAPAADWPRFRGPNGLGVSESANVPAEFGPDKNLIWKTPVPPGHSSPILVGDRIFLTAYDADKLLTIALDRATGKILWRREAPRDIPPESCCSGNRRSGTCRRSSGRCSSPYR